MAIIQILNNFYKKKLNIWPFLKLDKFKIISSNPIILISFIVLFSIIFLTILNVIKQKNKDNKDNLRIISQSSEFSNLTNYFISKINSPYENIKYLIKNNDFSSQSTIGT